jgi:biopolymer transport protein ExbD
MARRIIKAGVIEEPVVNLTPLIDVVFVILIMFIVIAPLLELDRVDLADAAKDPMEGSVSVQENSPISIHVRKDNTIWYGKQRVNAKELTEHLVKAKARYPKAKPQLFHDKSAHFGTYQSVKNAAEAAGFEQMDVVLKPA